MGINIQRINHFTLRHLSLFTKILFYFHFKFFLTFALILTHAHQNDAGKGDLGQCIFVEKWLVHKFHFRLINGQK